MKRYISKQAIDDLIEELSIQISKMNQKIKRLESMNLRLKKKNHIFATKIESYTNELEEIRNIINAKEHNTK